MLDLNIDITKNKNILKTEVELMDEDSGTSNSSIIDNQGETDSAFIFDIMKIGENNYFQNPITQQLFPERNSEFDSDLKHRVSWLKLSHGGQAELKIVQQKQQQIRKSRRGPRSRSSQYRGVTFYRRTGRWESHIWDCGKQVYLGGFDTALSAARAYDRAAIKFRGVDADINFTLSDYEDDMNQMRNLSKEEFVHVLRRQSTGFARNNSKYRGCGRWEPRIGQFHGKKEAVTSIGPTTYEGGIICSPNNNDAGEGHNLELSLGISVPARESKNHNNIVRSSNSSFMDCELPKMVENKHVNSLFHLPTLPGLIPGLLHAKQGSVVAASSGFGSSLASSTNFPFNNQNCHYYLHRS